jgi:hypothetical protein
MTTNSLVTPFSWDLIWGSGGTQFIYGAFGSIDPNHLVRDAWSINESKTMQNMEYTKAQMGGI